MKYHTTYLFTHATGQFDIHIPKECGGETVIRHVLEEVRKRIGPLAFYIASIDNKNVYVGGYVYPEERKHATE